MWLVNRDVACIGKFWQLVPQWSAHKPTHFGVTRCWRTEALIANEERTINHKGRKGSFWPCSSSSSENSGRSAKDSLWSISPTLPCFLYMTRFCAVFGASSSTIRNAFLIVYRSHCFWDSLTQADHLIKAVLRWVLPSSRTRPILLYFLDGKTVGWPRFSISVESSLCCRGYNSARDISPHGRLSRCEMCENSLVRITAVN